MLEPREADIPILFLVLVVLPVVIYILLGKWSDAKKKKERVGLLAQLAAEEALRAETMAVAATVVPPPTTFAKPKSGGLHECAQCFGPATTRCSRCKSIRYCSGKCQIIHWRQVHQHECQPLDTNSEDSTDSSSAYNFREAMTGKLPLENPLASYTGFEASQIHVLERRTNEKIKKKEPRVLEEETPRKSKARNSSSYINGNASSIDSIHENFKSDAQKEVPCSLSGNQTLIHQTPLPPYRISHSGHPTERRAQAAERSNGDGNIGVMTMMGLKNSVKVVRKDACELSGGKQRKTKMLFPYEEFVKFFQYEVFDLLPRGLINCGNSCYANAVLQCLTCTKPLTIYLLLRSHSKACSCGKDWCLMCELEQHVRMLRDIGAPLSPSRILSHMRSINRQIGDGSQEDAHEFLRLLIASMQSICLEGMGGEKKVDSKLQETTFIQHTFGGRLRSKVQCLRCHHESERYENIMDLTLEIYGWVESLEDALAQFTAPEDLDGENMYRCGRCTAYVRARKQLSIHEAPNILTIVLKRFQEGRYGKINKCITFPEMLDMIPYMTGTEDMPPLYMLYAVVVHLDTLNASFSGHYICYVRNLQGRWYRIDDTEVQPVLMTQVMSEGAYILFYMRSSPRPQKAYFGKPEDPEPISSSHCASRSQRPSRPKPNKPRNQHTSTGPPDSPFFPDATSSDWSLFTSSDDASFTTESTRDSFSTVDYSDSIRNTDPMISPRNNTVSCRLFSNSRAQTRFVSEEKGYVLDSYLSGQNGHRRRRGHGSTATDRTTSSYHCKSSL